MISASDTPQEFQEAPWKLSNWMEFVAALFPDATKDRKPKGKLKRIVRLEAAWSNVPNTLLEDRTGQLFLAYTIDRLGGDVDLARGVWPVLTEVAFEWMLRCLKFVEGHDGDAIDICRLALGEMRRLRERAA